LPLALRLGGGNEWGGDFLVEGEEVFAAVEVALEYLRPVG